MFFFNDTATTEIYTLSLHDALPISSVALAGPGLAGVGEPDRRAAVVPFAAPQRHAFLDRDPRDHERGERIQDGEAGRSEEHTSELQSRQYPVFRLLL